MSSSALRKGRGRSAAAAAESDNDDDNSLASHSSRASRSSARLKRKRESQAAAVGPIPEKGDGELDESSPGAGAKRSAKRQRVKSAKKKKPATKRKKPEGSDESSGEDDGEIEQKQSVPMEIETKHDNGDHRAEEDGGDQEEDAKLSAVPENGHAAPLAAAAASVPSMNHVEPAAAVAASIEPVQSERRASEPRTVSQQQPPSKDRLSSSLQKQRRESEPHERQSIRKEPPPAQQPQEQQFEVPVPAEEPAGNGDAAFEAQPQMQRITEYVVELSGYAWDCVYEGTTMVVVRASDVVDKLVGRRDADEQEEIVEEAVGEVILEDELKPAPWESTRNWFILALFLQLILFPYWINPILDRTAASSDVLLKLYSRGRKGKGASSSPSSSSTGGAESRIREQLLLLEERQTELEALLGIREVAQSKVDDMIKSLQDSLTVKQKSFNQANIDADAAIKELEELVKLKADAMTKSQYFITVSALLEKTDSSTITPLIDTSRVELWTLAADEEGQEDETCSANIVNEEATSPLLKREEFDEAVESAFTDASLAAAAVQEDADMIALVRDWIRGTLRNETDIVIPGEKDGSVSTSSSVGGAEMARLRRLLTFRLEQEMADQTGLWDYASIPNGAQVIRSKTSPSLVDTLPIFNRISSLLGLRFYGHGPEAALTPTHPPFALGQCWSFPDQSEGTTEPVFGVLTIRLSRPIYVQSVLIEHPPKDVARQGINSAIRTFHIQGFEEEDASGEAWELGSFEYKIGSESRQEFEVETEVNDEDVPVLRAISIEIESNWGGEYACLYRFRVHGEDDDEEEDED